MHRQQQLLLRGLPPLACEDGSAVASSSTSLSSSSSLSCVLLDDEEWRASSPRDAVAAALMKRHWHRCRSRSLSMPSPTLSHASALAFADKCWLECDGRPLPRDEPLGSSLADVMFFDGGEGGRRRRQGDENDKNDDGGDHHLLVVECRLRALGGGGDGGSTGAESRSSYLEMYASAKPDAVDPRLLELTRATSCALSGAPLRCPVVADALGSLYNKDAVLSALLDKRKEAAPLASSSAMAHVTSMRHVFDARMTEIGGEGEGSGGGGGGGTGNGIDVHKSKGGSSNGATTTTTTTGTTTLSPRFCCPITGVPLNGRNRFLLLRPSGIVVSERAVRVALPAVEEAAAELLDSEKKKGAEGERAASSLDAAAADGDSCKKIDLSTAIRLLPPLSELASAREKLLLERAAEAAAKAQKKKNKKDKKRKEGERDDDDGVGGGGEKQEKQKEEEIEAAERKRMLVAASTAALAPAGADKEVFASLFLSSKKGSGESKETFACRSTALGRR